MVSRIKFLSYFSFSASWRKGFKVEPLHPRMIERQLGPSFFSSGELLKLDCLGWTESQKTKEPSQMVGTYDEIRELCEHTTVAIFSHVGQDGSGAVDQSDNTRIAIRKGKYVLHGIIVLEILC